MRKIMVVVDDFKELLALENFLRRLGFDVLSLGKDLLVPDALLRFVPDILIATAKGRLVDGGRLAQRLRRQLPGIRTALLHPAGQPPGFSAEVDASIDALVEMPYQPKTIIRLLAQFAGIEPERLLEKYEKISTANLKGDETLVQISEEKVQEKSRYVTGGAGGEGAKTPASEPVSWDPKQTPGLAATARSQRSDRYERFLRENDEGPVDGVLPHAKAAAEMEKLKKASEKEKDALDQLNEEKMAFAKALFGSSKVSGKKGE